MTTFALGILLFTLITLAAPFWSERQEKLRAALPKEADNV